MYSGIKVAAAGLSFAMGTALIALPAVLAQDGLFGQVSVHDEMPEPDVLADLPPVQLPVLAGIGGAAGIAPGKGMDLSIEQLEKLNAIKSAALESSGPLA